MKRLIERGLMFGNLFHVNSPALVARYNRALKQLTGRQTALSEFYIDLSGYAPEIGDELGDHLYLNPDGCNRQFILLSTRQKTAPLLDAKFSTSREILRSFILDNEDQLFALTARDAVAGELDNSVLVLDSPARLFDIRVIEIVADTTSWHLRDAERLEKLIHRFRTEPDAWWDSRLIDRMIALADTTGDIVRNPIRLAHTTYRQGNFHTTHFGGIYIFRDADRPAAITARRPAELGEMPIERVIHLQDREGIAAFLEENGLVESIVAARDLNAAALLQQRLDFMLIDVLAGLEGPDAPDLTGLDRRQMRRFARRFHDRLPPEYHALSALLGWVREGADWPRITARDAAWFYAQRARPDHRDRDLVNMLLAELTPLDVRQLFICHKQAFYRAYRGWSEAKKTWVADFLAREYALDKAGTRRALYGPEPGMEEPAPPSAAGQDAQAGGPDAAGPWGPWGPPRPATDPADRLIRRVGPWGAIRR